MGKGTVATLLTAVDELIAQAKRADAAETALDEAVALLREEAIPFVEKFAEWCDQCGYEEGREAAESFVARCRALLAKHPPETEET